MRPSRQGRVTRFGRFTGAGGAALRAVALAALAALAGGTVTEAAAQAEFRINTGGGTFADYTDVNGDLFEADKAYVAGDFGYVGGITKTFTSAVGGTTDDLLYQMIRGGASFSYTFDNVPDGTYDITLYFTDPLQTSAGLRLFDVTVEGVVLLNDFDIVAASGGQNMATAQTVTTDVADGQLNISFAASASIALVSAIAVVGQNPPEPVADVSVSPTSLDFGDVVTGETGDLTVTVSNIGTADLDVTGLTTTNAAFAVTGPAVPVTLAAGTSTDVTVQFAPTALGTVTGDLEIASTDPDEPLVAVSLTGTGVDVVAGVSFRINAGGSDYTDVNGNLFVADKAYVAGDFGWSGSTNLTNTFPGAVSGTTDDLLYQSIRGASSVSYLFDDVPPGTYDVTLYFTEPLQASGGLRLIDVTMEGNLVLDDFDIFATSGGQYIATSQTVTTTVSDGQLTIDMTASSSIVLVSAIAVVPNTGTDPTPDIAAAPGSLNFGTVQTGTTGSRSLAVSNTGAGDLTVTGLSTTNPEFSVASPATPFVVSPGAAPVTVVLDFDPTVAGTVTGDLEISSDDPDEALKVVPLTGDATDDPVALAYRLNAGGTQDYVDQNGHVFFADQAYAAGGFGYVGGSTQTSSGDVRSTTEDPLYLTKRVGGSFSYQFDGLPAGEYEVRFYWNDPTSTAPGQREFDVTVEGVLAFDNLDLAFMAGTPSPGSGGGVGTMRAYSEGYITTVVDGSLTVDFDVIAGSQAVLSALAVREAPPAPLADFADVAPDVGIIYPNVFDPAQPAGGEIISGGAWADYDGDGDVDLYTTNQGGPNRLYDNVGDTDADGLPNFVDVAAAVGVDDATAWSQAAVFIDYDNDGDQDLYVLDWGANKLFENQLTESGAATFVDVTGVAGLADGGRGLTAVWGDFDQDTYLDVYIARHLEQFGSGAADDHVDHLYHNNGDGTFTDWSDYLCPSGSAPCAQLDGLGFTASWLDYDEDGDLDLYLVNDDIGSNFYPNVLWRNDGPDGLGGWNFADVSAASGSNLSVNGMGLGVGDFNRDGFFDFAISNISPNVLLRSNGDGTFEDVAATAGVHRSYVRASADEQWSWGTTFLDYDNDGWLDLLYVAGPMSDAEPTQKPAFFENNGDGTFIDRTATSGFDPGRYRHVSVIDFDDDGQPDVFMSNTVDVDAGPFDSGGIPRLYRNRGADLGNTNHWLTITVEGTVSNRDAIGTKITATTPDGVTQIRLINSGASLGGGDHRAAYFGLGENTTADVTIRWPNGVVQDLGTVSADQALNFVEPSS